MAVSGKGKKGRNGDIKKMRERENWRHQEKERKGGMTISGKGEKGRNGDIRKRRKERKREMAISG